MDSLDALLGDPIAAAFVAAGIVILALAAGLAIGGWNGVRQAVENIRRSM